jgi:acyl carrier protein
MAPGSTAARDAIERQIIAFLSSEVGRGADWSISPDEHLLTGEYLDSLGVMRLIAHLESTFRVTIPPNDLIPDNFRTVRVMAAYLTHQGAESTGEAG